MKFRDFWKSLNWPIKIIAAIILILLPISIAYSITADRKMNEWRDRYNAFRDSAAVVSARADSLERLAVIYLAQADSFSKAVVKLEKDNAALRDSISDLTTVLEPILNENDEAFAELTQGQDVETVVHRSNPQAEPWIRLSFGLKRETDLLDNQNGLLNRRIGVMERQAQLREMEVVNLRESLDFQTARANALQAIVDAIPEPPPQEKLFGIIPLPNRKTSMIIGAVGGAVTTAVIVSQF